MKHLPITMIGGSFPAGKAGGEHICREGTKGTAVAASTEAREYDAHDVLDSRTWAVLHDTTHGPGRAGSWLAFKRKRVKVLRHGMTIGTKPRLGKRRARMNERWIVWADVLIDGTDHARFITFHPPPKRYFWLWPGMLVRVRRVIAASPYPVLAGADWNKLGAAVRAATGMRTTMRGTIVGWARTPGVKVGGNGQLLDVGSDHKAVRVTVTEV